MIQPFKINIDQAVLDDLKKRLSLTRWPDAVADADWNYGTNKSYLQELCTYWQNGFDWKKQEAYLNSFPQYKTTINDNSIHFIHQKGDGHTRIPLLLVHGWPDSFVRFLKIIPLLTKADDNGFSFDVVVPSIPGYGFSGIPTTTGMNEKKIAGLFVDLMSELGYKKFAAHGGDWGSGITERIALYYPDALSCIHLTDIPFQHGMSSPKDPSATEKKFLESTRQWQQKEGAYAIIQATRPQTLGYGLNDSPAGLAGWIVEKFQSWSDDKGHIENSFTKDELLTNITIYWVTQTINSANRLYSETMNAMMNALYNPLVKLNPFDKTGDKSTVPAAFAIFPKDISAPPREFAERFFTVKRWQNMSAGGHFAAMEQPVVLASAIRSFVTSINDI